jgi:hypothetical protein
VSIIHPVRQQIPNSDPAREGMRDLALLKPCARLK